MIFPPNSSSVNGNTKLRLLCEEDRALFVKLSACKITMKYVADPLSEQEALAKFEQRLASTQSIVSGDIVFSDFPDNMWFIFSIIDTSLAKIIGSIGIRKLPISECNQSGRGGTIATAEIGFVLAPRSCGLGHGSRALKSAKELFSYIGVEQLVAICARGNKGSISLLRKSGFKEVNGFEETTIIGGIVFEDIKFSALLV